MWKTSAIQFGASVPVKVYLAAVNGAGVWVSHAVYD